MALEYEEKEKENNIRTVHPIEKYKYLYIETD